MVSLKLFYGLPLQPSRENVQLFDFSRQILICITPATLLFSSVKIDVGCLSSEFSRAMMSASTGSEGLSSTAVGGGGEAAAASLSSLATAIAERQQTGTTSIRANCMT